MILIRSLIVSLALSLTLPTPIIAQRMTPTEEPMIQAALNRGQLLYAYDQAAWHGTDAMLAEAKKRGLADTLPKMLGGWIVRGTADTLTVIFFDKNANDPHAVFVAQLTDGGSYVRSSHFVVLGEDSSIDEEAKSLIRARRAATVSIAGADLPRCSKGDFNIAVLPPDRPGGSIPVYISPQTDVGRVPFGGHYRIEVSAGGIAGPIHAFTKACLDVPTSRAKDKPKAVIVTQLLDPLPTEISVFTMFAANMPMYVLVPKDKRIWSVEAIDGRAQIRVVSDKPKT